MSLIRVGIVGYGFATKVFHAPLISATPGLAIAGIVSGDPAKVAADWPDVRVYASVEALAADVDLVVVPTPNDTHYPIAAAALAAGCHVVVDKPFTITSAEARDLIARAKTANKLLSVFHNRRWDGDFLMLRGVLDSGRLGRLVHFESHFDRFRPFLRNRWRETAMSGGGLWYDLGAHLLDQAVCLFGMPDTLALDTANQRDGALVDDWFHAILRYGTLRVVLHASALVSETGPRFLAHGTKGTFTSHGLDPQEDSLKLGRRPGDAAWHATGAPGRLTLRHAEEAILEVIAPVSGTYEAYYSGIRDAILGRGANPVPAEEAAGVIELIERGLEAERSGRRIEIGE